MTTPPEDENTQNTPDGSVHTCFNCFDEFAWEPTIHDGETYCCSGCVQGGPCICSYEGPPSVHGGGQTDDMELVSEVSEPDELTVSESHRQVLLEAAHDLPPELQQLVRLRITTDLPIAQLALELGSPLDLVQTQLEQAQRVFDRILGEEFVIEYVAVVEREERPVAEPKVLVEPELPVDREPEATAPPTSRDDLSGALLAPLEALTSPLLGAEDLHEEAAVAQSTIREALRDASAIFRLAAERLGEEEDGHPLRRLLAEESVEETQIIAEGLSNPAQYLLELDGLSSTKWARIVSKEETRTVFSVESTGSTALVSDLVGLPDPYKPTRLVVRDNEIEIELAEEASVSGVVADGGSMAHTRPVFELGADAFFGARHFVTMGGVQGPPHHHSFRVEVLMDAPAQDDDGVVLGFGDARGLIEAIVADYNETLLNTVEPFTTLQPTSENIAKVIFERLKSQINSPEVRLKQVRVWESPTNSASYSDAAVAI